MEERFTIVVSAVAINGARRQGSITDITVSEPSLVLLSPTPPFILVSESAPFFPFWLYLQNCNASTFTLLHFEIILSASIGDIMERLELLML
ncbi:uncharacterized protein DS421_6g193380 [Arachis hypogaea]|nr:uncharacterized protein DS421_6g193380 [Arachis hypogaea]